MGWLSRLLGRAQRPIETIAPVVEGILERVSNLSEYRRELVKAAQKGDLDGPYAVWARANRRAQEFIDKG